MAQQHCETLLAGYSEAIYSMFLYTILSDSTVITSIKTAVEHIHESAPTENETHPEK
jgi:hypothetical protein